MPLNTNNRIFWAVQAVGLAADGSTSYTRTRGVQSVGVTTAFNLEQVFQLGQSSIYENIENLPSIEVTMEKALDGQALLYHLATPNATSATLIGRSNVRCSAALSIFADNSDSASGTPNVQVTMSGLYFNSATYTLPVDGNCTESVTLTGNHKAISSGSFTFTGGYTNADSPVSGIMRRQNVIMGTGAGASVFPSGYNGIPGINSSGRNALSGDKYAAHIQSISFSVDLGREDLLELGQRNPYYKYANFPVEVTTDIEVNAVDGDFITATTSGYYSNSRNIIDQIIFVQLTDGTKFDLGSKNKLSNVSYGGGDTGGGNATVTYTYSNFNDFKVTHPADPAGLS